MTDEGNQFSDAERQPERQAGGTGTEAEDGQEFQNEGGGTARKMITKPKGL